MSILHIACYASVGADNTILFVLAFLKAFFPIITMKFNMSNGK